MRQQSMFWRLLGNVAVFILFCTPIQSQQKIQIKNGTAPAGHFFVEFLHNMPGAPMKAFQGNGGKIDVTENTNKFIMRMQNFVWYDPDQQVELLFDVEEISTQSTATVTFAKKGSQIFLRTVNNYIRDIHFEVTGKGNVKIVIPFAYEGGDGRFLQEFTIVEASKIIPVAADEKPKEKAKKLRSKDVKDAWSKVDVNDMKQVDAFIVKYKDESVAKRYLSKAKEAMQTLLIAQASKRKADNKKAQDQLASNTQRTTATAPDVEVEKDEMSTDNLVDDVKAVVDSLYLNDDEVEEELLNDLYLFISEGQVEKVQLFESQMPLQLQFKELGKDPSMIDRIPIAAFSLDTTVQVNNSLLKAHNLKGDFSTLIVLDAYGKELSRIDVELGKEAKKESNSLYYIIGISALLLLFGLFVLLNNRRKEKKRQEVKKEFTAKIKENLAKTDDGQEQATGAKVSHSSTPVVVKSPKGKTKIKIGAKAASPAPVVKPPTNSIARSTSKIKITKRKTNGHAIEYDAFVAIANEYKTVNIDLGTIWEDTTIRNVYLAPDFIKSLDNFLADSSNDGIQNELQGAIPEVGGFMMGRFAKKDGHLEVLVEKFVPFVPEYNDVFKIEIGTKTVVDELGDAQDKNPELEVIGWFHTHPGHGLFLSTSDLSVQRHFPNNYQVAMEIDSLTKGLDMSIFTRQSTGRMNNSNDRKAGVGWFQWVDIDNSNVK